MAALERVNILRASLGLPEKNLDNSLRPRKPCVVEELVEDVSSGRDSASSVYSQESATEQTHQHASQCTSVDSQTASGGHKAAEAPVWEDPYAYLDHSPQSSWSEQYP